MTGAAESQYDLAERAASYIAARAPLAPRMVIVLGSGLGSAFDPVDAIRLPYREIPHFPVSTVEGHAGTLLLTTVGGTPSVLLSGRAHLYEGYSPSQATFGVRVARLLGAETLVVTNAAGGVNPAFEPGQLMAISDHINLTGLSPLVGPNDDRFGPRFPDMSGAYDSRLIAIAHEEARVLQLRLAEGVYLGLTGPSFETPAEVRMIRTMGADAVGMSTVLEVIAARHMGMRVLGFSLITNAAAGVTSEPQSHAEVIETSSRAAGDFARLVTGVVARIAASS